MATDTCTSGSRAFRRSLAWLLLLWLFIFTPLAACGPEPSAPAAGSTAAATASVTALLSPQAPAPTPPPAPDITQDSSSGATALQASSAGDGFVTTPTPTPIPMPSPTPLPTATPIPTSTPTFTPTLTPIPTATVTPTPRPSTTPPPSVQPTAHLVILSVDLKGEVVTIANQGNTAQVMTGWKLVSMVGNQVYTFPAGFALAAGASVKITSGPANTAQPYEVCGCLPWLRADGTPTIASIWNDSGDPAELRDATGIVVSSFG